MQYQNKWARVSANSPQKEQDSDCFRTINFKEVVVCCYSSVKEYELEHS